MVVYKAPRKDHTSGNPRALGPAFQNRDANLAKTKRGWKDPIPVRLGPHSLCTSVTALQALDL